jgi:hypothetical protein
VHVKRAVAGLLTGALAAAAAVGAALPGVAAAGPPNGTEYELVSPHASRGIDFSEHWVWGDGDHALLSSWTGDPRGSYVARRTPSGWQSERRDLTPPDAWLFSPASFVDGAADLSWTVAAYSLKPSVDPDQLARRNADGSWTKLGGGVVYAGGSADGERVVLTPYPGATPFPEVADPTGVFLWDRGQVSALGGDAANVAACGATVADGAGKGAIAQNGISAGARSVVLTSNPCGAFEQHVLLWRDGVTVDLSAPAAGVTDGPATYVGDAPDGSAVFFRTAVALDPADANGAEDVYRHDVATGASTRVTGAATDAGATLGSAISSDDGTRLWFGAKSSPDDDALWVWTAGGTARAIAAVHDDDPFAPEPFTFVRRSSGSSEMTQVTPDGAAIVWIDRARLDGFPGGQPEVFRATADGEVACVSCLEDRSSSGPSSFGTTSYLFAGAMRRMSDDGRTVAFETYNVLDPFDWNYGIDVYQWRDGVVSLLSPGGGAADGQLAGVSPRGDVFVATKAKLLPWVEDPHRKVYVARIGGGFPAPADDTGTCSGDACQGDPVVGQQPPAPGSESFSGPGDADEPEPPTASIRLAKVTAAGKRRLARGHKLTAVVRATTAGRVTATLRYRVGKRWVKADAAGTGLAKAGTARVAVRLSRTARRRLARNGALRVRLEVAQTGGAEPRQVTFTVKGKKAAQGRRAHA